MTTTDDDDSSRSGRPWGRLAWLLVPAIVFVGLLGMATVRQGGGLEAGDRVPVLTAPRLTGAGSLSTEDLRGKPALVNFWASWCVPCVDEAGILESAYDEYGAEIEFVGVNIKDARSDALAFVDRYDVSYGQVRDEELDWYDEFGLTGQPETFLVDADGEVVRHLTGEIVSAPDLFRLLDVMLARDAALGKDRRDDPAST